MSQYWPKSEKRVKVLGLPVLPDAAGRAFFLLAGIPSFLSQQLMIELPGLHALLGSLPLPDCESCLPGAPASKVRHPCLALHSIAGSLRCPR